MAGRIRAEDVATVRERSPIAEVIGEYLELRNAGGDSLKGLCPFHDESTPSFHVTPSRGLYYCFGCEAGGDVLAFVREMDQLSFSEAVEALAQRAGIQLRYEEGGYVPRNEQSQRQRLLEAHRVAAEFYAEQLLTSRAHEARQFLKDRGFTRADAEHFGVGYAPPGWEVLTSHLRQKGFTDAEIMLGGLASQGRRGPYDKFRNRLVWPVREITGEVVGFGARRLDPEDTGPKYLNTQETPIFKKSSLLYGLDLARREISRRAQVIVVEGYTDVMACHLAGEKTAVATCGTAFSSGHVQLLRRLVGGPSSGSSVIFTFDGDAAGHKAAVRAFEEARGEFTHTYAAIQPDGLDPCDLRLERNDAGLQALIDAKRPLSEVVMENQVARFDVNTIEGQLAAIDAAAPALATVQDPDAWEKTVQWLARQVKETNLDLVKRRVRVGASAQPGHRQDEETQQRPAPATRARTYDLRDPTVRRERQALKLAIQFPHLARSFDELDPTAFTVREHQAMHELIRGRGGVAAVEYPQRWGLDLYDAAPNEVQAAFLTELASEPIEVDGELSEQAATEILRRIRLDVVSRQIAEIRAQLERQDQQGDPEEYNRVFVELMTLQERKRMIQEGTHGAM
ncbi:DNA primase [Lipingzhangella sp. LS1_29]|uniref:DNA primase n=1 Tax=Lipingzhangella rawalii TaxID=2055835 RepID=A0ABU2H7E2_9ACTN|nr:DNA primase [Lipingzhangella rawalii]MDS1271221.1 DNA primase [Lipingzhangella rawalii]